VINREIPEEEKKVEEHKQEVLNLGQTEEKE